MRTFYINFNLEFVLEKNLVDFNYSSLFFANIIQCSGQISTLRSLINVQSVINVQGDKFSKKNKRTGRKSSSISVQG